MSFFSELRSRRLFQIVAAYAAAGWVALEVLGALIERGILPEFLYPIGLIWYGGGLVASTVVGWYHGEKGDQRAPLREVLILVLVVTSVLSISGFVFLDHRRESRIAEAAETGFPLSRVAVLYFDDQSSRGTGDFLGDVLTEALIDQLRSVDALQVLTDNAVLPLRGQNLPADSVGSLLEVGTVIDGSVAETESEVRVRVQLLHGNSGFEMASAVIERPKEAVLEAPEAVAEEVANLFRERLGEEVRLSSQPPRPGNLEAWRALQSGESRRKDADELAAMGDPEASVVFEEADSLAGIAQKLDEEWIDAPVLRARISFSRAQVAVELDEAVEWIQRGLSQAQRAVRMDPDHSRALEMRGALRLLAYIYGMGVGPEDRQVFLQGARQDLERAVRLDRTLASAYALLSVLYYQPGIADLSAAALAARQAYEADAFLGNADDVLERLFWTNLDMGQFAQARRWCDEGARRFPGDPRFVSCELWLMTSPGSLPDLDQAWEVHGRLVAAAADERADFEDIRGRMLVAGAIGRLAESLEAGERRSALVDSARSVLAGAHDDYAELDDPTRELAIVEAFARVILDDFDAAIDRWKTYAAVQHGFQESGDISWRWEELRSHPRFQEVVTQEATH